LQLKAKDGQEVVLAAGGVIDGVLTSACFYDSTTGCNDVAPLLTARYSTAAATLNGKVVVAGGYDERGTVLDSVEQFDAETNSWTRLPSLLQSRRGHALVAVGSSLLALGGNKAAFEALSSVERYEADSGQWQQLTPLKFSRSYPAASAFKVFSEAFCGSFKCVLVMRPFELVDY
jgi:hypothetical protein